MSTRSMVGWKREGAGRYIHSDGYPSGVGYTLCQLIREFGVDETMDMLTRQHYGWSCIEYGYPEWDETYRNFYGDGRFECVVGWGTAYTDTVISGMQQTSEDEWVTASNQYGTAFQYLVHDNGMFDVYHGWTYVGTINPFEDGWENAIKVMNDGVGY